MMRLAYALALGLVVGGLVHIGSLLGVPLLAKDGAYDRLASVGADGRFVALPDEGTAADVLPFRDPAFVSAVCRYDLTAGSVTVSALLPSTYGALAVHDRFGKPFYALTDRAATKGAVEVTILSPQDAKAAEVDEAIEGRPALRIVSPTLTGFIMVRLFAAGASARPALRAIAEKASCAPTPTLRVSP